MSGDQSGEGQETVTRKTGCRDDAKRQWSCLTTVDLSGIRNGGQLIIREGPLQPPDETAKAGVEVWMAGKQF